MTEGLKEKAAERRRKRKSRWGQKAEDSEAKSTNSGALVVTGQPKPAPGKKESSSDAGASARRKKRRSRWGSDKEKVELPPQLAALAASQKLTAAQTKMMLLKLQLQEISTKLVNPSAYIDKEAMSPSPEPTYDSQGKRTNTRDIRFQKKLMSERQKILDEMVKIDPNMAHLVPKSNEWIKLKVPIPVEKYPDYNFIGLIIGPRGNTQKRLQKETGAKIFVRGKEPGNRKMSKPKGPDDDEPLHVLITARDQASVDKAEDLIKKLLVPLADHENKHKAMQLRELAAMNGTALDVVTCRNCGERGHRIYECPKRQGGSGWSPANVKCSVCGSDNHPDIDCPQRDDPQNKAKLEKLKDEYSQFMAELGGEERANSLNASTNRGAVAPMQDGKPNGISDENDWICTGCKNSNYSFRPKCNRCGADRKEVDPGYKPQAGADGGGKNGSGGAGNKDPNDWVCKKCGNENYSFRKICNKCKHPKLGMGQAGAPNALGHGLLCHAGQHRPGYGPLSGMHGLPPQWGAPMPHHPSPHEFGGYGAPPHPGHHGRGYYPPYNMISQMQQGAPHMPHIGQMSYPGQPPLPPDKPPGTQ